MIDDFETWYKANRSYFHVKHGGDTDKMDRDAMQAHNTMRIAATTPAKEPKKGSSKKKPNPYGFNS